MTNYSVPHALGAKVIVKAIDQAGIVDEISIGHNGMSYRISYWWEGKRFSEWMNAEEIGQG